MSAGGALRGERERRRISLETIARATMIRLDYLELIDADLLEHLPTGAYAKGFIRAYATYLGLDPVPYVKAYEQRCDAPAPELSSVVRQPVRVPNAAHPRAWRTAAGAGVAALILLGVLGVVRSGDETAKPPTPSSAEVAALTSGSLDADRASASPTPNPAGAVVRVEIVGPKSWIQVEQDGDTVFAGTMQRGQRRVFRGLHDVFLVVANAHAVKLVANGRDVGTPPGTTYRGTFTPMTRELPPSQAR
jgi:hypothetical protein